MKVAGKANIYMCVCVCVNNNNENNKNERRLGKCQQQQWKPDCATCRPYIQIWHQT
jgi:hypothetical protein